MHKEDETDGGTVGLTDRQADRDKPSQDINAIYKVNPTSLSPHTQYVVARGLVLVTICI